MSEHRNLTGASLHEPKGVAAASAETYYKADGSGSGAWSPIFPLDTAVWDDYVVPIINANAGGISPPGLVKTADNGAGSTGVYAFGFAPSGEEEVFFTIQLPHRYKAGTNLRPHIHWAPVGTGTGNVVWGLEYAVSLNGAGYTTTIVDTITVAAPGVTNEQVINSFAEISGTGMVESSLVVCRFFRAGADADDTYAADAVALSFDVHFQVEKMGTVEEYPGA